MKKLMSYRILTSLAWSLWLAMLSPMVGAQQVEELSRRETALLRPSPAEGVTTNETATIDQQQRRRGFGRFGGRIEGMYKAQVTPHWFAQNSRFWYRNDLRGGAKEFILVDAEQGRRQMAFDHRKLADALSKALGEEIKSDNLPLSAIEFAEDAKSLKF